LPTDVFNLLVDPATLCITAVVDFELAHAGPAAEEFLNSFVMLGHVYPGVHDPDGLVHGPALLAPADGFPDNIPMEGDGAGPADWKVARAIEKAFAEEGVERPRTIRAFGEIGRLYWFAQEICQ
jgi:hypothetical protein